MAIAVLTADPEFEQSIRSTFGANAQIDLTLVSGTLAGREDKLDFAGARVVVLDIDASQDAEVNALQRLMQRGTAGAAAAARPAPSQLVIPDRGRTWVIAVDDIEWLEAADNYVVVHAGTRAPLLRRPLTALLADLGEAFVRTQRGAAVAVAQVASVQALSKGDATVVMKSGAHVPCSRQLRAQLMQRLQPR